ncbi:MAG: hypothetical protein JOZ39_01715, partial [Chloroflexi bacterium]|nr:hypothetical protein [Chloroflexota bacterium]
MVADAAASAELLASSGVDLKIPSGAVGGSTTVEYQALSPPSAPPGLQRAGPAFQLTGRDASGAAVSHFQKQLSIDVPYDPALPTAGLAVYYQEPSGAWRPLPSVVDEEAHVIHALTDHFTTFSPFTASGNGTLALSRHSGPAGTSVTFTGNGYTGSSTITITMESSPGSGSFTTTIGTCTATAGGALPAGCTFNIPAGTTANSSPYAIRANDGGANTGQDYFLVEANNTTLTLSLTSGSVGRAVTLNGTGYLLSRTAAQMTVQMESTAGSGTYAAVPGASCTTNAAGALAACTMTVPARTAGGNVYGIEVSDGTNIGYATFGIPSPTLARSTTNVPPGTSVTLTGANYQTSSALTFQFGGAAFNPAEAAACDTSTAAGAIAAACTFTTPDKASGAYTLTATDPNGDVGSVAFTIATPTLVRAPINGAVGTTVTLTGANYKLNSTVSINFNGASTGASCTATAAGALPGGCTFTVPSVAAGTYTIQTVDTAGNGNSVNFTVPAITLTLNPTNGPDNESVTVTGTGYLASSNLTLKFETTAGSGTYTTLTTSPNPCTTTAAGAVTAGCTFTVPTNVPGVYAVRLSDTAGNTGAATFTVNAETLVRNPTNGPVGTTVTMTGTNWEASSTVTIGFENSAGSGTYTTVTTCTSTAAGALPAGCTFAVPTRAAGTYNIQATDPSGTSTTVTYTINAPTLVRNPNTGAVGTTVTMTGTNWEVSSPVTIGFENTAGGG